MAPGALLVDKLEVVCCFDVVAGVVVSVSVSLEVVDHPDGVD